jgi:hypothetical protein
MTINFKKVSALATSALLVGLSMGTAMAATTYPAPFVSGSSSNVAIVYGATADAMDSAQADKIETALGSLLTTSTGSTTVTGGEAFKLEKSSNSFNFNNSLSGVYSSLDSEQMSTFLADGTYDDGDIEEDYTQEITLGSKVLSLFKDTDYNDNEPTVGFYFTNGDNILNYTMEFDTALDETLMNTTEMPLFGGKYYVLTSTTTKLELLDSSEKTTVALGESATVNGKNVKVDYVGSTTVKFTIDGESTGTLEENEEYELDDGSYVVVNDIMASSKDSVTDSVEFSIGKGKLTLENDKEVKLNDDYVKGLTAHIALDSSNIKSITLQWDSYKETFLTADNAITMPGFNEISVKFDGLEYPEESEIVSLDNGETLTLSMGNYDLPVMYWNGTEAFLGEEDYLLVLATANNTSSYNFTSANLTGGIELAEKGRFLVTDLSTDLGDTKTAYYEVTSIDWTSNTDVTVELEDLIGNNDLTFEDIGDTKSTGTSIDVNLTGVTNTSSKVYLNFAGDGTLSYRTAVSEKGLKVTLPTAGFTAAGAIINFTEADKDGDLGEGVSFSVSVNDTANDKLHVSSIGTTNVTKVETTTNDLYTGIVKSDLASKITTDESADENDFEVEYFGEEVIAGVSVVGGAEVVTSDDTTSALGDVIVKDTEVEAVKTKNLIVVGGSCVNSVAATLLGSAACGADFTAATTIGSGQFLIQSFANPYASSKIALLVAGYEKEDTANAATYLLNNDDLDITAGKKWKSTSAIAASLVSSEQ